jgi:hypothetical protein
MPKRRPPPFRNSPSAGGATDPDLPSLLELERFTTASLHQWITAATRVEALHRALYFGLETLRQRDGPRLIDAVRSCTHNDYSIDHWSRIVDYRYSLEPLSVAGSLRGDGGRFNIGSALGPSAFTAFPALYCAADYPTAFLECFGAPPGPSSSGLTGEELALRKPTSFTHVSVRGQLENVLDVTDPATLRPIVDIIKEFQIPKPCRADCTKARIAAITLVDPFGSDVATTIVAPQLAYVTSAVRLTIQLTNFWPPGIRRGGSWDSLPIYSRFISPLRCAVSSKLARYDFVHRSCGCFTRWCQSNSHRRIVGISYQRPAETTARFQTKL